MYDRVLVPLDGSPLSEEIIPYAAGLATAPGTTLTLLRVVHKDAEVAAAEDYMQQLARRWSADCLSASASGSVDEAILREAGRVPRTLVAMTSRGRAGLMNAVLGSVALRVVRSSAAPVVIYHPLGHQIFRIPIQIRSIIMPLDGTELSESMIPTAVDLARRLGAGLQVVGVIHPKDLADVATSGGSSMMESAYVRSAAARITKQYGLAVGWETLIGKDPAEALAVYLLGRIDTMLAMATRGRSAMRTALLGSVTANALRKTGVPVLMRVP